MLSLFSYGGTMAEGSGGFSDHRQHKVMAMQFSHGGRIWHFRC